MPHTQFSVSPPTGWTSGAALVELLAFDDTMPCMTYYQIGGGPQMEYGGPFEVTQEGKVEISFWSQDSADIPNVESPGVGFVYVDKSGPLVQSNAATISSAADYRTAVLSVSATDTLSGMYSLSARFDGASTQTVPSGAIGFAGMALGPHVVTYSAVDMVGNKREGQLEFSLRDTPSIATSASALSAKRKMGVATFKLSGSISSIETTALAGAAMRLEQRNSAGKWVGSGSAVVSNGVGRFAKTVKTKKAGKTYWRWRVAATSTCRQAVSRTITLTTR